MIFFPVSYYHQEGAAAEHPQGTARAHGAGWEQETQARGSYPEVISSQQEVKKEE